MEGRAELAMIAHELGGALAPARNALQLLKSAVSGSLTAEQERLLAIANRGLERAGRVLENIAGIALPEAHEPRIGNCVPGERLASWVDELYPEAEARGIELGLQVDPGLQPFPVDLLSLEQVISNLLSNALKFTPRGGHVRVWARPAGVGVQQGRMLLLAGGFSFKPRFLQIAVEDSGVGLSEETRRRLFQPFFRGAEAENTSGMGLGLAVARRLVRLLHGDLRADPCARGARFVVTLPADEQTLELGACIDSIQESLRTDLSNGRQCVAVLRSVEAMETNLAQIRQDVESQLHGMGCRGGPLSKNTWVLWSAAPVRDFVRALDLGLADLGDRARGRVNVQVVQASRPAAVDEFLLQVVVRCRRPLPIFRSDGKVFHVQAPRR